MASEMMEALMTLCQEKHIDELYLLDRLEQSLAKSYADVLHLSYGARVTIDRTTGKVYVYELVPKGEPDEETGEYAEFDEVDVTPEGTSRFAAQHAKNEIRALVRDAARQQIYEEFSHRIGDIITGTVLQSTPDFTIIKIREGVEAELPHFDLRRFPEERDERPFGERYGHNQRIKAIIIDVRNPNNAQPAVRGERQRPPIVVSRTHPDLIRRLFELEVPEVYEGIVSIRSCVGPKGSRVRTVVSELRGERVDVVPWFDDPARCVASALSPARVSRVIIDAETRHATVIVPDDQLSLAIGKEGQNARLAARLTGLHIDIKNETLAAKILRDLPATPADLPEQKKKEEAHRCIYVSPDGVPCRNMARPGSNYCGIHERMAEVQVSDDEDSLI